MADPSTYRPASGSIPELPGVYRFRDDSGRVIYVGKAKSLRQRLNSYFQDLFALHQRTLAMVTTAASVEWTVVSTEVEALQLEYSWIKEYDPRFNVRYRDDKSYPYLAVTLGEEFPRVTVMRGAKRAGTKYFGPYAHAWAIRETVDLLLRVFPMRSCTNGVFTRAGQIGRPCLLGYIGKCSAPCVGRVDADEHRQIALDFVAFLEGQTTPFVKRLERRMKQASDQQEYEQAARLRDDVGALRKAMEKNAVVLGDRTDADLVGIAEDPLEVAVQVFFVRGGRVRGQRGWVADRTDDAQTPELVGRFLAQLYDGDGRDQVPREVLVPTLPEDTAALTQWLTELRGSQVSLRVPRRGDKVSLLETVTNNAGQALTLHKTKRASDLTTRSRALEEIQQALDLPEAPLRIECIDVSNLQATEVVASLVVFEDGLPRKSEFRRFHVRGTSGQGDVAAIHEVVTRRFKRYLAEREEAIEQAWSGGSRKFAYAPSLLVVDGGAPQVAAAKAAMDALGIDDIALCGLAKRLEEVWVPGQHEPVILPRTSEGLYLLQRIRDESHRFAITFHRQSRSRSLIKSALDDVPGLGETRKKALLKEFGSMRKLQGATAADIAMVSGIGPRTADAVVAALAALKPAMALNTATGEVFPVNVGNDGAHE